MGMPRLIPQSSSDEDENGEPQFRGKRWELERRQHTTLEIHELASDDEDEEAKRTATSSHGPQLGGLPTESGVDLVLSHSVGGSTEVDESPTICSWDVVSVGPSASQAGNGGSNFHAMTLEDQRIALDLLVLEEAPLALEERARATRQELGGKDTPPPPKVSIMKWFSGPMLHRDSHLNTTNPENTITMPGAHWERCYYCFRKTLNFGTCSECDGRPCKRWCEKRSWDSNPRCPEHWPENADSSGGTIELPFLPIQEPDPDPANNCFGCCIHVERIGDNKGNLSRRLCVRGPLRRRGDCRCWMHSRNRYSDHVDR